MSFTALLKEINEALQLKADIEKKQEMRKAMAESRTTWAESQSSGLKNLQKVKNLGARFAASLRKAKSEVKKSNRERAEALLQKAHAALASGTLDAYRTDLLKQRISELERAMKGKK